MIYTKDALLSDLEPFADLGTKSPAAVEDGQKILVRFIREGDQIELLFHQGQTITERYKDIERKHSDVRAMLASPSFANLGRWADSQAFHLKNRVGLETIPLIGRLSNSDEDGDIEFFDNHVINDIPHSNSGTSVTLVNGPAGIGKTSIIRALAYRRASTYRQFQSPLILHVESRGRVLQNLTDLMAFSLQTLRTGVTYDQVPTLVRNGLIVLAIDGFDELGDPNGYDLAWAQVNDLIESIRGRGSLILAGRETFISYDRMERALPGIDKNLDKLQVFTLCELRPQIAKSWLLTQNWSENMFNRENISPLFESGSYALRPFFLSELAREGVSQQITEGIIDDLFSFLIEAMIDRETSKFGNDIEKVTSKESRATFIRRLMEEVARDQAENQSDSISIETISWLAEIVAQDFVDQNLSGILRNRAAVIAFLIDDDRRGYRRFAHEQVANYFLSAVSIRAIAGGEIPKYIRRNILGLEFLENFCSVFRRYDASVAGEFFQCANKAIKSLSDADRARRNIATLAMAACSVTDPPEPLNISNLSLDDVFLSESVAAMMLDSVTIQQLYARETDMRSVVFGKDCFIASFLADEGTKLPLHFPVPTTVSLPALTLREMYEKDVWIRERQGATEIHFEDNDFLANVLSNYGLFRLLDRLIRYKPYWLKDGDEKAARRILDDPHWDRLKALMLNHDFLVERHDVPAAGKHSPFYHVKNKKELMMVANPSQAARPFFLDMFSEVFRLGLD